MGHFHSASPISSSLNDSASKDIKKPPPQLTAATPVRHESLSKAQLEIWQHTAERHEQIALALETSESQIKTERWLADVEQKIEGFGK